MVYLMFVLLIKLSFVYFNNCEHVEISDNEYGLMPELFYLDNFDQCILNKEAFAFCTFNYKLRPLDANNAAWKVIQATKSDPLKYKHDILRHGICLQKSCPEASKQAEFTRIKTEIEQCYNIKYNSLEFQGNITNLICQTSHDVLEISTYDITVIIIIGLYLVLIILGTLYEEFIKCQSIKIGLNETKVDKLISAFSITKNWRRLTSKNSNPAVKKLRCIHGIKFYTTICVIMIHTVMVSLAGPVSNPQFVENVNKNWLKIFLTNGWFAVQSFFVISGWLLSYHFYQIMEKEFKLKYLGLAVFNRYLRLTPTLLVIIIFNTTWLAHVPKGPYWHLFIFEEYQNCRKNWWTNLLYINNYFDVKHMCLMQTWYLAADTQLFILATVILMLIWKYPNRTKLILAVVTVVGIAIPGIIAYEKSYDIVIRQYPEDLYYLNNLRNEVWHALYSSSHSNIGGYMIGVIFGSLFFKYGNKPLEIKKIHVILWWFLSFGLCVSIILVGIRMHQPNFKSNRYESAFYWSFGKNLFAVGIAIGIFGITQKIGWLARWILEWDCLETLSRLTYSSYVVHSIFQRITAGYRRYPVSATDNSFFLDVLGQVTLTLMAGTVLCLTVEMPISALQKFIIPQIGSKINQKRQMPEIVPIKN